MNRERAPGQDSNLFRTKLTQANAENENGQTARWDFIPPTNAPSYIITKGGQVVGSPPPGEIHGLPSVGVYGPITVVEQNIVPPGYFVVVSTAGPNSTSNAISVRELHGYAGFRQVPGNQQGNPLQESFYTRGFGTGVRSERTYLKSPQGGAVGREVGSEATGFLDNLYPSL